MLATPRLATTDDIRRRSAGIVKRPELLDEALKPLHQGLLCPALFGEDGSRFAHVELPVALHHPFSDDHLLEALPIPPPMWRPVEVLSADAIRMSPINDHYYDLVLQGTVLRRLIDLNGPRALVLEKQAALQTRLHAAFGTAPAAVAEGRTLPPMPLARDVQQALKVGTPLPIDPETEAYAFALGVVLEPVT